MIRYLADLAVFLTVAIALPAAVTGIVTWLTDGWRDWLSITAGVAAGLATFGVALTAWGSHTERREGS